MSDERPGWHRHPNGGGWVQDTAQVDETVYVGPNAEVYGTARVCGSARVYGTALVCGSARVSETRHVLTVGPIGSEDQTITIYRTEAGHGIVVGCWDDPANTVDDLAAEVQRRAPEHAEEYAAAEQLLRLRINEWENER